MPQLLALGLMCLGDGAFLNGSRLTSVSFLGCTALRTIGQGAFQGCAALASLVLTGCTALHIGVGAFKGCSSLRSLDLSNCAALHTIGVCAFMTCAALVSANLPISAAFSLYPFGGCTSLDRITWVHQGIVDRGTITTSVARGTLEATVGRVPDGLSILTGIAPAYSIRSYGWGRVRAIVHEIVLMRRAVFFWLGITAERHCAPGGAWRKRDLEALEADVALALLLGASIWLT